MTPAGEPFAEAIDGQDGKTWHLPLAPLNATSTPEAYSPGEQPHLDRLAAAARLVRHCVTDCQ
jgi:glutathione S-transferase